MLSEVYNIFILVLTLYRSFRRMSSDGYNFASVNFLGDVFMMAVGHGGKIKFPFVLTEIITYIIGVLLLLLLHLISIDEHKISLSLIAVSFCLCPGLLIYYQPWAPFKYIHDNLSLR